MKPIHRDFALREVGCVLCRELGLGFVLCAKHHTLTTGMHGNGKRRGEKETVGLCDYHHQGSQVVGTDNARILYDTRGPSYHDNAREFRARWPDKLLLALQEKWLRLWELGEIG